MSQSGKTEMVLWLRKQEDRYHFTHYELGIGINNCINPRTILVYLREMEYKGMVRRIGKIGRTILWMKKDV